MTYVNAEKLENIINTRHYMLANSHNTKDYGMYTVGIMQAIREATEPDVKLIVRCKNCIHKKEIYETQKDLYPSTSIRCSCHGIIMSEDGFCSDGESEAVN